MLRMCVQRGTDTLGSAAASTSATTSIREAKHALRKQMRQRLASLEPASVKAQSAQITEHVTRHEAFVTAQSISVYVSMAQGEVHTEDLCRRVLKQGKRLYVPRFAATLPKKGHGSASSCTARFDTDMRMLRVSDWDDYDSMVLNKWGIREPADDFNNGPREDALLDATGGAGINMILVPGVAFDAWGGRLGHGKGYYDRYIAKCAAFAQERGMSRPVTMALALHEQILDVPDRVPTDGHDEQLDITVSPKGPIHYRADDQR